ncbi:MAG: hypothetical protein ACOX7J_08900 [Bacillota bacterium]|jgi:hypothetical protein
MTVFIDEPAVPYRERGISLPEIDFENKPTERVGKSRKRLRDCWVVLPVFLLLIGECCIAFD